MKINYNDWFYQFHRYLTNSRDGVKDFNDTNWANIQEQLQRLIDINSALIHEQPRGVIGNEYGIERLLTLMEKSGYTFEDIHKSLTKTYENTLRMSMSRNLVNTRIVIYHTKNMRKLYSKGKYYIVDIPFDQLRFGGERDEFIRQKFADVHDSANERFMDLDEFTMSEYTKILNCAFIASVNGFICNDIKIAMNDHGLKFMIGYTGMDDAELILYKLDNCHVYRLSIGLDQLKNCVDNNGKVVVPGLYFQDVINNDQKLSQYKGCIVDIFDNRSRNVIVIPNFGTITKNGELMLDSIQPKSIEMFTQNKMQELTVLVYVPKFWFEIPWIYPAANYLDMTKTTNVYTDLGNNVIDENGKRIIGSVASDKDIEQKCTPPICIDREWNIGFDDLLNAIDFKRILQGFNDTIIKFGNALNDPDQYMSTYDEYKTNIRPMIKTMYETILPYFKSYTNAFMIMGIKDESLLTRITTFVSNLYYFAYMSETIYDHYDRYVVDDFFYDYYVAMTDDCCDPFVNNQTLTNFNGLSNVIKTFYQYESLENASWRYTHAVSEQCFVSMRYSRDYECWLFTYPEIKPFHGIGNVFYINNNLRGDEVFKFFVLYSETFTEPMVDDSILTENVVLDYDTFMNEVDKHVGFIRYWHVENKLMKLSKLMFNQYNDQTVVNIISKILKRDVDALELLHEYDSELQYDRATATTFALDTYYEDSVEAPFILNFMFYGLNLMRGNVDKMQSYFYKTLVDRIFVPRYVDYAINGQVNASHVFEVNFSGPSGVPNVINTSESNVLNDGQCHMYYGTPLVFLNTTNVVLPNQYTWVFDALRESNGDTTTRHPLINHSELDETYWITFNNMGDLHTCKYVEIQFARFLINTITTIREYETYAFTNYQHAVDQRLFCKEFYKTIQKLEADCNAYYQALSNEDKQKVESVYQEMCIVFNRYRNDIENYRIETGRMIESEDFYGTSKQKNVHQQANWFTRTLKATYFNTGFQENTVPRVRKLYIHFKQINKKLNLYQYGSWLNVDNYDSDFLTNELSQSSSEYNVDNVLPEYNQVQNYASRFYSTTRYFYEDTGTGQSHQSPYKNVVVRLNMMRENDIIRTQNVLDWCSEVIRDDLIDMYVIDDIKGFEFGAPSNTEAAYATWEPTVDSHFINPLSEIVPLNVTVAFTPMVDADGVKFTVTELRKPCEYVFFNGEPISNCTFRIYDINGTLIRTLSGITVTFAKVSDTGNKLANVTMLPNVGSLNLMFENKHETFNIHSRDLVNAKHNETHYELLISNKFTTVDKYSELVLNPRTMLQGSQDVVYLNNEQLNVMLLNEYGAIRSPQLAFQPYMIPHVTLDDGVATSIGGRYCVGQTIYLYPNDHPEYVFPVKITAVDHSDAKGFLEAVVDTRHCGWLTLDTAWERYAYLTSNVTCTVLDDNLSNFLDEYNNSEYVSFYNPPFNEDWIFEDEDFPGMLSVPGDPLYVQTHANYVYTRLNWMFPEEVKNRFMNEDQKTMNIRYIGWGRIDDNTPDINKLWISCINHNWSTLSLSEQYPVLRNEPNDHAVWTQERNMYDYLIKYKYTQQLDEYKESFDEALENYKNATTDYDKDHYSILMANYQSKIEMTEKIIERLNEYIDEPEHPTTWYNVASYDAAMTYIDNGRARQVSGYKPFIRDIPTTENIMLYDWENKQWIDPSLYTVTFLTEDHATIDVLDDYATDDVPRFIEITVISDQFPVSKKILVYIAYDKSDLFNDIENHSMECNVRFRCIMSTDKTHMDDVDIYQNIRLRKHIEGFEEYEFSFEEDFVKPDDFSKPALHVIRNKHSGSDPFIPTMRYYNLHWCFDNVDNKWQYYDVYVKHPFPDVTTNMQTHHHIFNTNIEQPIDNLTIGEEVTLICVENYGDKHFDTTISNITFKATITAVGEVEIMDTSLPNNMSGTFVTTIIHNNKYKSSGGLITVDVTVDDVDVLDEDCHWIKIDDNPYRILPDEFLVVPKITPITPPSDDKIIIRLKSIYVRDHTDNNEPLGPYSYYYDNMKMIRYPRSSMVENKSPMDRLFIDKSLNPDVKTVFSNHIGVCRYFNPRIPENGFMDVTGYLSTPLSRDRYEFWVNGRQLSSDNILILSPTSFQLIGLTSLKNFELIELVDDVNDTLLTSQGCVYTDLNGVVYASYEEALQHIIVDQHLQYTFNMYPVQHTQLQNYSKLFVPNPDNMDLEPDIMETIRQSHSGDIEYTSLNHIPTINNVPIYYPTLDDLGMIEMDVLDLIPTYDHTYREEIWNDPYFPMTHRDESMVPKNEYIVFHMEVNEDNTITIHTTGTYHKYFMLYLSRAYYGSIDDTTNTVQIIPYVKTGVRINLPETCRGLYVHATIDQYIPLRLM